MRVVVVHLHVRARVRARAARYLRAVVRVARAVSLVLIHMLSMCVVIHTSRYSRALIKLFRHIVHAK
jgi:endonuclease/exonuclease/phosphatase family metal-dependent hydrolase